MNPFQKNPHIIYAVSKKADGNMSFKWGERGDVIRNRKIFLEKNHLQPKRCAVMDVEHGEKIVLINSSDNNVSSHSSVSAEVLITQEKDIALFLLTADCFPISLYDPKREVIALAHLGWKPTGHKLITKVIEKLKNKFASNPDDLLAYIGPGIHKESYVFENPIQKTLSEWSPHLYDLPSGETQVDLIAYNKAQMLTAGLRENNIFVDDVDTAATPEYFSHYRSARTGEPEGRFATVLALKMNA